MVFIRWANISMKQKVATTPTHFIYVIYKKRETFLKIKNRYNALTNIPKGLPTHHLRGNRAPNADFQLVPYNNLNKTHLLYNYYKHKFTSN